MKPSLTTAMFVTALCAASAAFAQQRPAAPAGAVPATSAPAPASPPAWQQGRPEDQAGSPLHPFAPHLAGRPASELPIDRLRVPPGFKVEVWAEGVPDARSLALGSKGTVFVSTRLLQNVYAIVDRGGKREVKTVLKGLRSPNGIAFDGGTLYVAERHRITRYDNIEDKLDNPGEPVVIVDGLDPHNQPVHYWKYLAVGPEGKLYFNIGSPQNITMPTYMEAVILRVDPNSGRIEDFARGVRNSGGMAFHPVTRHLWFTEHGRDWLGDDSPSDELNLASQRGEHFGFPFCHQGDILDPIYGKNRSCREFKPPQLNLGAHVAPLGMRFYTGTTFPAAYRQNLFLAQHGSWNRTVKQGFNVIRVVLDPKGHATAGGFLDGFLLDDKGDPPMWGRPVDVLVMTDGSLLVSDDYNGIIYRVSYSK